MKNNKIKVMVSACLLGENCRYDGKNSYNEKVISLKERFELVPICPETLGKLKTPRSPSEIKAGRAINKEGIDVTDNYLNGAKKALKIAKDGDFKVAILKSKSPACGKGQIYDGSFSNKLISADGICVKLFKENDIDVYSELEIDTFLSEYF